MGLHSSLGPPMVPAEGGPKILSLNALDRKGAEAKIWLSASEFGRGGGEGSKEGGGEGGPGGGVPPILLRCTAVHIHYLGGGGVEGRGIAFGGVQGLRGMPGFWGVWGQFWRGFAGVKRLWGVSVRVGDGSEGREGPRRYATMKKGGEGGHRRRCKEY